MPKLKKRTIILFILAVILMYVLVEVLPRVGGALADTEIIEYGKLRVSDDVEGWIVRDETVYKASGTGNIKVFTDEGTLVKKGSKLMDFKEAPKKTDQVKEESDDGTSRYKDLIKRLGDGLVFEKKQKSGRKGIFSQYVDGYESTFTPKTMKDLSESDYKQADTPPENLARETVTKGDPVYKIADNSAWYIVCWIDEEDISKYEKGKIVSVRPDKGKFDASVNDIKSDDGKWRVILKTNRYYSEFMKSRLLRAKIVTTDSEGLLISNDCLTTKDKKVGCYVKNTAGDYVFREVQTLGTDGKKTLVTEKEFFDKKGKAVKTVRAYDEVKRN